MTETPAHETGDEPLSSVTALHEPAHVGVLPDATEAIRAFNSSNRTHEDLWSRTRQATDMANHAAGEASRAEAAEAEAELSHRAVQAEHTDRRAPRVRQLLLAAATIALDGLACNFAAQAL